jgi:nucleotide-binding universal stress UspA family protein
MRKIVVATDGSSSAFHAVAFGVELAAQEGAAVSFVHVASTPARDESYLEEALRYAVVHAVAADARVLSGDTVDEIVAFADSLDSDLIVLGARGRSAFTSALLGSTTLGVLHEARRPILVVRSETVGLPRVAAATLAAG